MQTHSIDIPVSLQKLFSVVPENAVLFGGAIRDLIRGKDKINDLDLLFNNQDDINKFFESTIRKIDSNATISSIKYFEQGDDDFISDNEINVNVKRIYFYIDEQIDSKLRCIDCIVAKNPTNGFLSDYDVNALYGVVKDNKVEVVGNIIKYNSSSNLSEPKETPKTTEQTKTVKETKEEKKMTNTGFDTEFFTKNLVEGAYAGAANEVINNLAKSLVAAIKASGMDEFSVKTIEEGLNSPVGKILLSIAVGAGVRFIPLDFIQQNPHMQKVAEKCVENAGSNGTQFALNGVMNFVLPAVLGAIQDNPQLKLAEQIGALTTPTKTRVEPNVKDLVEDLSEEEANAFNEEFAKKKSKSGLNK